MGILKWFSKRNEEEKVDLNLLINNKKSILKFTNQIQKNEKNFSNEKSYAKIINLLLLLLDQIKIKNEELINSSIALIRELTKKYLIDLRGEFSDLKYIKVEESELVYNTKFLKYAKQQRIDLRKIVELIRNGEIDKSMNKPLTTGGMIIEPKFTGSFSGGRNGSLFRCSYNRKSFFIKIWREHNDAKNIFNAVKYLQKIENKKINGFKIAIIRPHIVYGPQDYKLADFKIIVSDFMDKLTNIQIDDIPKGELRSSLDKTLKTINQNPKIMEILPVNSFYDKRKNTIKLFDFVFIER
jgi:hypothetical protein